MNPSWNSTHNMKFLIIIVMAITASATYQGRYRISEASKKMQIPIISNHAISPDPRAVLQQFQMPIPQPYPVQVPVPHPVPVEIVKRVEIPIERLEPYVVEKKVPYVVEKPYAVTVEKHFQVPIPKPYPVHVPVYKHVFHHQKQYERKGRG